MWEAEFLHKKWSPQYTACLIVNFLSFIYTTFDINTRYIPVSWKNMKKEEISWIFKAYYAGCVVGALLFGYVVDAIGRKKALRTCAIFFILNHLLILTSVNISMIYAGKFIIGIGCTGVFIVVPIYLCEISEDYIRGRLCSLFHFSVCLGFVFRAIFEFLVSYETVLSVGILLSFLFLAVSDWLPETPIYSVLNNRREEAVNALVKLRGDRKLLVETELETLIASVQTANDRKVDPGTRRGLIIGSVLVTVRQLSNTKRLMANHAHSVMLKKTLYNLDALYSLLQLIAAIIATVLIGRAGQKLLLLVSSIGMIVSFIWLLLWIMAIELMYLKEDDSVLLDLVFWSSALSNAVYTVSYHVGFGPIVWILLPGLFKAKARVPAISFLVFTFSSFSMLVYQCSTNAMYGFQLVLSGTVSVLGAMFVIYFVPETEGKSLEMISAELGNEEINTRRNRKRNVNVRRRPSDWFPRRLGQRLLRWCLLRPAQALSAFGSLFSTKSGFEYTRLH